MSVVCRRIESETKWDRRHCVTDSDAEVRFEPESSSRFKEQRHRVKPIVMSRVSNERIMPPHVHSVQIVGYETARPRGPRYPKGGPRDGPAIENFITSVTFPSALEGPARPLFVGSIPTRASSKILRVYGGFPVELCGRPIRHLITGDPYIRFLPSPSKSAVTAGPSLRRRCPDSRGACPERFRRPV